MLGRSDLHEYQINAIDFLRKKNGRFLDMGLGKTATSLTVASEFLDQNTVSRVLIVAPLRVANTVWKQESEKWGHLAHLKIGICTGTPLNRKKILAGDYDIIVINRENIPWLVSNDSDFNMVIVDESSSFKSHASQRFKALRKITTKCKSVILLSGTPSPNGYKDLWAQIYLLDDGARLGKNITEFRRRYCTDVGYGYSDWVVNESARDVIKESIADLCVSMSADDYLSLPPRIDLVEFIDLPPAVVKIYEKMKRDFLYQ
ncbi:MAG: DEAD/DEAH box helicase family protein [Candidatus Methanofishera endochildressiae]|uniref:DEAD/DEAH box helicase family protein n=1 Tax=Candidatus Methanofishera endochildressiae TaxID=2738884 RepID=A0A7Z0MML6_9GAMM|nr:DEAD/DEAH box helicase family protein [Candidatus Methanofishera endochildressiae]